MRKHVYHRRGVFSSTFIRPPGAPLDDMSRDELEDIIARVGLDLTPGHHELP
jgi:hypothetical protein